MDLASQTIRAIRDHRLINKNDKVVVGISGGPDSVALLHVLHHLRYLFGLQVHAAHFNHQLHRGDLTDQKFVAKFAHELNIPLSIGVWDHKENKTSSLEEKAREARFKFFKNIMNQMGGDVLALAHHQDDLAETVLMRILRGTGLYGLRSLLHRREIKGMTVIRPFLDMTRFEIEHYLKIHKLKFRVDPTNAKSDFTRNKIRNHLLPMIKNQYNPDIQRTLVHLGETAVVDYDFLEKEMIKLWDKIVLTLRKNKVCFQLSMIQKIHPAMQRMLIRRAVLNLKGHGYSLTLAHFQDIDKILNVGSADGEIILPQGLKLTKTKDQIILSLR